MGPRLIPMGTGQAVIRRYASDTEADAQELIEMKKRCAILLILMGMILASPLPVGAETRTVSWNAVTSYTDGTPFAAGTTVTYNFFWTSDPGLSAASLRTIVSSAPPQTSGIFDPDAKGMPRGQTVYLTGEVLLSTGEKSGLSPAYSWTVPIVTTAPTLSSLSISGPSSVSEGSSGTYAATAAWSDGTTTSVTPAWSVSPTTYASIGAGGVLTTLAVTSDQTATVGASYTAGGVTKTATRAVTIVNVAATLSSLSISGPSSVSESSSGTYTATAAWSDGSTTSVSPTWNVSPTTYASIGAGGVLTTLAVTSDQTATVGASYTAGGVTKTASRSMTIVNVAATLSSLSISGPSSVSEGSSGMYAATASWSDGSTMSVTPAWSVSPTTYASIGAGGVLTTLAVTSDQTATVSASYTAGGVTKTATRAVTIVNVAATLSSLSISGPSSVNENNSGTYAATASWSDGSTTSVSPAWSVSPTTYASIGAGGILTTLAVTSNQTATVSASYTAGGVTKTASGAVTIVDVPPGTLAPMRNVAVTGPVATSPARLFRLSWEAVSGFADGTPIPSGTVRYTAYWTTDPGLSASTLKVLASIIAETSVTFDPVAQGMPESVRVYFTAVATAPSGAVSPLSPGVSWVASNVGPAPPSGGVIIKR